MRTYQEIVQQPGKVEDCHAERGQAVWYGLSQSDGRADIYALGVLLNIMLTGEHPSRKLAGGRMGRIVQRCTMVNPAKRYKNILHLMEVL